MLLVLSPNLTDFVKRSPVKSLREVFEQSSAALVVSIFLTVNLNRFLGTDYHCQR